MAPDDEGRRDPREHRAVGSADATRTARLTGEEAKRDGSVAVGRERDHIAVSRLAVDEMGTDALHGRSLDTERGRCLVEVHDRAGERHDDLRSVGRSGMKLRRCTADRQFGCERPRLPGERVGRHRCGADVLATGQVPTQREQLLSRGRVHFRDVYVDRERWGRGRRSVAQVNIETPTNQPSAVIERGDVAACPTNVVLRSV